MQMAHIIVGSKCMKSKYIISTEKIREKKYLRDSRVGPESYDIKWVLVISA